MTSAPGARRHALFPTLLAAALLLALTACSPGPGQPHRSPSLASPPRTANGPVLPTPHGQNGLPPGVSGSSLVNPPGTMGSQLPVWARKEAGLRIPIPPPPHGALIVTLGSDISEWQGATNLAAYDRGFLIMREQYGTAPLDRQFLANRDQARARNLPRAFYHYAYPEYNTPEAEARTFAYGTDWRPGEGAMLDFEEPYGDPVGWSLRFMQAFEAIERFKPTLYVNVYTLYAYDWARVAANGNGLIAAQWNFNQGQPPSGAFGFAAGKQYTDADSVGGISGRVDGDVWYGDAASFTRYGAAAGTGAGPVAPPPPPTPAPAPVSGGGCSHTVRVGETLSGLVGARWPQVAAGNGIANPNRIFVGQVIDLCAAGTPTTGAPRAGCVTVRRGDTLSSLFGGRWPTVARANGIRDPNLIFPGERICA